MKKIKIAFFDIDGTLIDMNTKEISSKTIYALNELKSKGIKICVATGRGPMTLPKFDEVEFDVYLTFNGSYCYNTEKTLYSNPISKDDLQILLENAARLQRPVSIATSKRLAANGWNKELAEYYEFAKLKLEASKDFDQIIHEKVYQAMLSGTEDEYGDILKNTKNVKIAAWWDKAVDVIPATGGKGKGIQEILAYYKFEKDEAIAFGDGNNDIEMFEVVGTAVAMGNASEKLKEIATDLCGHVADDGIYHYCVNCGLIENKIDSEYI